MDVVYVFKNGPMDSIELRYSLRSLKNIKHDRVFVIGNTPKRIQNVIHIPYKDKSDRLKNVRDKYRMICDNKDISKDFILMNDDFYITNPVDKIGYYHRGRLDDTMEEIQEGVGISRFYKAIEGVHNMYPDGYCYSTHIPIVLNKKKFKKIMDKYGDELMCKKSLYCNYYGIVGEYIKDVKIYKGHEDIFESDYLSTNNDTIETILEYLETKFPNKSIYEKSLLSNKQTMLFKAKPFYNVHLGTLVRFNSIGEFETDNQELIDKLMTDPNVSVAGEQKVEQPKEDKQEVVSEVISDISSDIGVLREQYKEKFGKKAYAVWTADQLQEKLA